MSLREVAKLDDLALSSATRVVIDNAPVAVVRTEDGEVYAIGDTCTHADVSLSEGDVVDCSLECWLHGSSFDLRTGEPLSLPAITPVPTYAVTVTDGTVFVEVEEN